MLFPNSQPGPFQDRPSTTNCASAGHLSKSLKALFCFSTRLVYFELLCHGRFHCIIRQF